MKPPFPSLTAEWHNDTYAAIDPRRPELSMKNESVIITGAGRGIGRETARAYAVAGASRIAVLGRTSATLEDAQRSIEADFPSVRVSTHTADIADETGVQKAAAEIGKWDVLVLNAGKLAKPSSIVEAELTDWWRAFETNVKGAMVAIHSFLPHRNSGAVIVGVTAGMVNLPASLTAAVGCSAYVSSKMAQIMLLNYVAAENPDVMVVSVHPGVVMTDMLKELGIKEEELAIPVDTVRLPAHFFVWVASPEARFLRTKFVYANWDVEELKARSKEIEETLILTANILGWPFEPK